LAIVLDGSVRNVAQFPQMRPNIRVGSFSL